MTRIVARRVKIEMEAVAESQVPQGEPVRRLVHGGRGTLEFHVLETWRTRFFEDLLLWNIGGHFQMVALQVIMAELLAGATSHRACGLRACRKILENANQVQMQMEVAKSAQQWRWLRMAEISRVSVRLSAEVGVELHSGMKARFVS